MEIPKQIKVGAYTYDIVFVDEFSDKDNNPYDEDITGNSDSKSLVIKILSGLSRVQTESTFIHEIIEAINDHYGIDLEHHQICALESGVYQVCQQLMK